VLFKCSFRMLVNLSPQLARGGKILFGETIKR
jgi:hypothetical protein